MKSKLFFVLFCLWLHGTSTAQTFEIRAVNKGGGYVGVEMRSTSGAAPTTANFLTDLVFGLKWQKSYNVDLVNTLTSNYNIVKSDVRKLMNDVYYQAFSAANTPFTFPAAWQPNQWTEILSVRNTLTGNGMGTFEIVEPGFDLSTDPNVGSDLVDYTPVVVASATNVPLPVHLTIFTATPVNKAIHVKWNTAAEQNNRGFEVERSENKTNNFQRIGWVESRGSSNYAYEFLDKNVVIRTKYYYRLKQIDNDEKYRYSEVRSAILEEWDNVAIRFLPNPTNRVLQVFFDPTFERRVVTLKVMDAKGVVVLLQNQTINASSRVVLNVSGLASGAYFLVVETGPTTLYAKTFQKL